MQSQAKHSSHETLGRRLAIQDPDFTKWASAIREMSCRMQTAKVPGTAQTFFVEKSRHPHNYDA
jgi:hypothetical protein